MKLWEKDLKIFFLKIKLYLYIQDISGIESYIYV